MKQHCSEGSIGGAQRGARAGGQRAGTSAAVPGLLPAGQAAQGAGGGGGRGESPHAPPAPLRALSAPAAGRTGSAACVGIAPVPFRLPRCPPSFLVGFFFLFLFGKGGTGGRRQRRGPRAREDGRGGCDSSRRGTLSHFPILKSRRPSGRKGTRVFGTKLQEWVGSTFSPVCSSNSRCHPEQSIIDSTLEEKISPRK